MVRDVVTTNEGRGQLVVANTNGGYYAMWHDRQSGLLDNLDDLARRALLDAWWERPEQWYRVGNDPCRKCGHYRPLCTLCLDDVSVFPDAEWMKYTIYLCVECGDFSEDVEVGIYSCCESCVCGD